MKDFNKLLEKHLKKEEKLSQFGIMILVFLVGLITFLSGVIL